MSFWKRPMLAASSAVAVPMIRMKSLVKGASSNSTELRTTRKTPAVTIVAAWINALTGVGPAMASGSQVSSGIWALLPMAPTKSSIVAATISPWPLPKLPALSKIST